MAEQVVFWVFATIGIGAGIAVVVLRNVVHAALMLVVNLVAIAALFLSLQSSFLGVVQVIVYAGAIMVLFLFVIMLLGVDRDDLLVETRTWHRIGAALGGAVVVGAALLAFAPGLSQASACGSAAAEQAATAGPVLECRGLEQALAAADDSSVQVLADRLFSRYTFAFEGAALLLTVATMGAIVLGRRRDADDEQQPEQAGLPGGGP